jgi:hypothetical protein
MRFEIFAPEMQFLAILENVVVANYGLRIGREFSLGAPPR